MLPAFALVLQVLPIDLYVDATQIDRGVVRVTETMPAAPGRRGFYFPKYIPGEHRASGPINGMASLHFFAGGKEIVWNRDPLEPFRFLVDVPPGSTKIEARFVVLSEPRDNATPNLARLKWNRVLLYPEGRPTDAIPIQPALVPPKGWSVATALESGAVSVTELIDSPAILGRYTRSYELGAIAGAPVAMDVMAEQDGFQNLPEAALAKAKELVRQVGLLYQGRHFRKYRFLVTLSDAGAGAGLEHHESSEDGSGLRAASTPGWGELLAHEFNHSWCGKYRRPVGLATPDFHRPMDGSGLWVYEGLTQYMGYVLAARSGFTTPEGWRTTWANLVWGFETQPGRLWRPVIDTGRSVGLVRGVSGVWAGERRGTDYYTEGALVWLEADALIRRATNGARSLDDFLRRFFGGTTNAPTVKPFTTADVVRDLNAVHPYDWAAFLRDRIERVHPGTPAEALEMAGFRLALVDGPPRRGSFPALGASFDDAGSVTALAADGPAVKAGMAPGDKVVKLDGKLFGLADLVEKVGKPGEGEITLETASGKVVRTPFVGGPMAPRIEPAPGQPDILSAIARPLP